MELSRQNLALIGVGAATVVLGFGIVLANAKIAKDVDAELAKRRDVSRTLQGLDSPVRMPGRPPLRINAEIVRQEQHRVDSVRADRDKVVAECTRWNRRNFKMLSAVVQGEVMEAFPVDRQAFEEYGITLPYNLTQAYINEINSLLKEPREYKPGDPLEKELRTPLLPAVEVPGEQIEAETLLLADKLRASPDFADVSVEEINDIAEQRVRDSLIARSIQGRLIYAGPEVLDRRFQAPMPQAGIEDIWYAQVGLWAMQDIIEAIRLTNARAVQGLAAPSVVDSAVKRLIRIQVYGYGADASSLTGRTCCEDYDVLRYRFIVVLPPRQIPALARELMSLNCHTIVNVSTKASYIPPDGNFEYGPDPVVTATFDGELLLLTAWERGTWDGDGNPPGWSEDLPPLIPEEVLKRLAGLREEDRKRLAEFK